MASAPVQSCQPKTSDATYCARCGTAFGSIRVIVDGKAYHQLCGVVQHFPVQKDEIATLKARIQELEGEVISYHKFWIEERAKRQELESVVELLESNAREQAKLLADTGRRVEEMEGALRKSETALGKVAGWLGRLATACEQRAKDNRFQSLADANAADAKNYRSTIVSIMPTLEAARAALSSGEAGK